MTTHPSKLNDALHSAWTACNELIADARDRGDTVGSGAWSQVLAKISDAEHASRDARTKQTWRDAPKVSDAEVQWFSHPPHQVGGQHLNRVASGVLGVHIRTGLCAISTHERSQLANKQKVLEQLEDLVASRRLNKR